ncbi:hypothetical protein JCM8097_004242 [Rhodosporidiobolus ruineniae]
MPSRRPPPSSAASTPPRRRSSLAPPAQQPREPKMAVLAAANRIRNEANTPRRSLSGSNGANAGPAPLVVESQRYEEWMKIATDNKITSTNTWNLALIDYFHDMSLLRNGDDNSINFQKASCTLDGCVKIWTSRVDSVATETGKLLSGLGEGAANGDAMDDEDDDGDEDGEREQKRAQKRAARAATTLADSFSKLRVKSFDLEFTVDPLFKKTSADFDEGGAAGLLMNHLAVDGGMRVVFDAGDARIECDEEDQDEETRREMEERKEREREEARSEVPIGELYKCFDLPLPSSRPAPPLPLSQRLPVPASDALSLLSDMSLCPSLSSFKFSADSIQSLNLGIMNLDLDDDPLPPRHGGVAGENAHLVDDDPAEGGYGGGFDGNNDFGGGFDDDQPMGLGDFGGDAGGGEVDFFADEFTPEGAYEAGLLPVPPAHFSNPSLAGQGAGGYGHGPIAPFDPRHAGPGEVVLAMQGAEGGEEGDREAEGLLEYFDAKVGGGGKNWAGPEHWKMKRRRGVKVFRSRTAEEAAPVNDADDASSATGAAPAAAKKKREKVAFAFDFSAPPPASAKELFAPAGTKSTITSSLRKAAKGAVEEEDFALPADFGFKSQVLLRLFLKPKMTLRMRRRLAQPPVDGSPEGDVQFWAQAGAVEGAPGDGMGMGMGFEGAGDVGMGEDYGGGFDQGVGPDDDDFEPAPFDTQWLAGDASDPLASQAAADDEAAAERELDDLAAASTQANGQSLRRLRVETVSYAKRAKRVDVKRLKESIWRELEEVVIEVKQFPKELVYDPSAAPPAPLPPSPSRLAPCPSKKHPAKTKKEALIPVVSSLRRQYPQDKMSEISTSYMFICLLHLANEKGLRIQTPLLGTEGADEEMVEEGEERHEWVGGLEGLRVLKEVGAEA